MSEPTRYYPAGDGVVKTDPKGPLINHYYYEEIKTEFERLKDQVGCLLVEVDDVNKENARLKAEVERLTSFTTRTIIPNEILQAKVEWLTKAGDAMAKRTEFFQKRWDADELCQEVEAWNAAK